MENGLALAAQPGDRRDPICIYWCATLPTGLLIPMAGGEVVPIRGHSINENRYGWHFHLSSIQMSIHRVPRFLFRRLQHPVLSLMMAQPASTKSPTSAGRISLTAARRVVLCVPPGRVPPRRLVPRNGFSLKALETDFIQFMFASQPLEPQPKARSIPCVTQTRTIKWL